MDFSVLVVFFSGLYELLKGFKGLILFSLVCLVKVGVFHSLSYLYSVISWVVVQVRVYFLWVSFFAFLHFQPRLRVRHSFAPRKAHQEKPWLASFR